MTSKERPQFNLINSLGYPVGLAIGSFGGLYLASGLSLSEAYNGWPWQVAGVITVGYSLVYAANPVLYDFGPSIKRLERRGRKVFLGANGEREIIVNPNAGVSTAPLLRLPNLRKRNAQMNYAMKQPEKVIATRDVVFLHNGRKISGRLYDRWLQEGYKKQLLFEAHNLHKSGLTRAERGQLSQPLWTKLRDLLAYTVEWFANERGILIASDNNGGFILQYKPSQIYDWTCWLLA